MTATKNQSVKESVEGKESRRGGVTVGADDCDASAYAHGAMDEDFMPARWKP